MLPAAVIDLGHLVGGQNLCQIHHKRRLTASLKIVGDRFEFGDARDGVFAPAMHQAAEGD